MYKFKNVWSYDERSDFANDVCLLILKSVNNDIEEALKVVPKFYKHFDINVRNVYELISDGIPLFALYELKKYGADNYGLTEEEYQLAIQNSIEAIKKHLIAKIKK
jgi:hypothetical protein